MKKIKPFFWGIIAGLGALVFELSLSVFFPPKEIEVDYYQRITFFLILVVLIEETFKLLIIYKNSQESSSPKEISVNSAFIGAGFFAVELLFREFSYQKIFILQILGLFFLHLSTSLFMGYLISKKQLLNFAYFLMILAIAAGAHFLYNITLIKNL